MEITFTINQNETTEGFVARINHWLCDNPCINISKMFTDNTTSFGFLVNKENLNSLTLIYENHSTPRYYQFGSDQEISLMKLGIDTMKENWHRAHPGYKIICSNYSWNARGKVGSLLIKGIGAMNRNQLNYIYRPMTESELKKQASLTASAKELSAKSNDTAAVNPSAQSIKFCMKCGTPITQGDRFCKECGNRLI